MISSNATLNNTLKKTHNYIFYSHKIPTIGNQIKHIKSMTRPDEICANIELQY